MACDYEFGKFTFLDELEPVESPKKCKLPKRIEIPQISDLGVSSDEVGVSSDEAGVTSDEAGDPKSLSTPSSPIGGEGNTECSSEGVKRKTNGLSYDLEYPNKKLAICDLEYTNKKSEICEGLDLVDKQTENEHSEHVNIVINKQTTTTCKQTTENAFIKQTIKSRQIVKDNIFSKQTHNTRKQQTTDETPTPNKQTHQTNKSQQQTNKTQHQTNKSQQQTNKSQQQTPKSHQQTNKTHQQTNKQQQQQTTHQCHWYTCQVVSGYATLETLYDHVLADHITPCQGQDIYMCQWDGCRVFNVPSSSYNGFRGHVLGHTKAKMYRCLIDECPASFRTIEGLAHHMEMQDNHFIIPTENRKTSKPKPKPKYRAKPPTIPSIKPRQTADTFSPMRRSRRLHHTPSFKRYFVDNESDEEDTSKPVEFLQEPALLGIQQQAESMTSHDLLQSMREQSSGYSCDVSVDKCIRDITDRDIANFQVLGQRMLEDSLQSVEYLCGFSKTLLDWIAENALPDFIQSSLSISIPDSHGTRNALRMRTNKRK